MIIPAALNIKKGDFLLALTHFIAVIKLGIQILQYIYENLLWPLSPPDIYFWQLQMMVITFFYDIVRIVRWILKQYDSLVWTKAH